jgi:hypothetical protein
MNPIRKNVSVVEHWPTVGWACRPSLRSERMKKKLLPNSISVQPPDKINLT